MVYYIRRIKLEGKTSRNSIATVTLIPTNVLCILSGIKIIFHVSDRKGMPFWLELGTICL